MSLALLVLYLWFTSNWIAAMLDLYQDDVPIWLTWPQIIKNNILIKLPDHENPLNGVSFMSLALLVLYLWFTSNWMATMLDLAKMAVPLG